MRSKRTSSMTNQEGPLTQSLLMLFTLLGGFKVQQSLTLSRTTSRNKIDHVLCTKQRSCNIEALNLKLKPKTSGIESHRWICANVLTTTVLQDGVIIEKYQAKSKEATKLYLEKRNIFEQGEVRNIIVLTGTREESFIKVSTSREHGSSHYSDSL